MRAFQIVAILAVLFLSSTALGWGLFNDGADNNCATCHDGTVVMAAHSGVSCLSCHTATSGDVPVTSNCSVCHGAGDMVNFHNGAGINSCAVCHAELPNERSGWGDFKKYYK